LLFKNTSPGGVKNPPEKERPKGTTSDTAAVVKFEVFRGNHPACTSEGHRSAEGWGIELDHS